MPITIAALRETATGERRVAITPETAKKYKARGLRVLLESGAGVNAGFRDEAYADAQCVDANEVFQQADVVLCVQPLEDSRAASMKTGALLVGQLRPHGANERLAAYARRGLTAFSLELLPRTTRAQAMDVLSSQAAVAGYRAMLIAAEACPKFFPMLTTAAGTLRP
ncbi:MAG TPA: NAD(P)(+) transhydrogenase (Re/Si-specific) subunit alpha, partial [Rhodanobacteraceae bacterium]